MGVDNLGVPQIEVGVRADAHDKPKLHYLGWRVINFDCCVEFASVRARQLYAKRFHPELAVSHVVFAMQCVGVVE